MITRPEVMPAAPAGEAVEATSPFLPRWTRTAGTRSWSEASHHHCDMKSYFYLFVICCSTWSIVGPLPLLLGALVDGTMW